MHIVDGALSNPVVIGGAVAAASGIALGLRSLDIDRLPTAGVLSASFFVASLIHVPIGPSSVHLILNGMAGLLLGWAAFPALFVGLLLQAVFFGFGGLTVLGINTVNIALPAVVAGVLFGRLIARGTPLQGAIWGALAVPLQLPPQPAWWRFRWLCPEMNSCLQPSLFSLRIYPSWPSKRF